MKSEKAVTATHFKVHCLRLLEEVRGTRQSLIVTRHGRAVAEVVPTSSRDVANPLKGSILRPLAVAGTCNSAS